jgi:hypothetical protein
VLAQRLDKVDVRAREESDLVVAALLVEGDGLVAGLTEGDLGHLVRAHLLQQRGVRPRVGG